VSVTVRAPVPLRGNACGDPAALSATVRDAVSVPAASGLNVIVMEQEALIASVVPQVFVCENEVAFVPAMPMLEMSSTAVPELVSVMAGATFVDPTFVVPKVTVLADSIAEGPAAIPLPARETACGDP